MKQELEIKIPEEESNIVAQAVGLLSSGTADQKKPTNDKINSLIQVMCSTNEI